jgi:prepilin-type N-terminal cleavage/methylation domain-containing protein
MSFIKSKKSQQGFTLVEVIVVAVIIAILAGVAIPLYLNYINNSRLNTASNAAGSAASFAGACMAGGGVINLAAGASVDGPTPILCTDGTGDGSSLIVPENITLTRTGNVIHGHHADNAGTESGDYAFAAAPPAAP